VIRNYAWLHLSSIFTIELHVITVPSYTARDNSQTYCIKCTLRKVFTNSSAINNVQHYGLKFPHSSFPVVCYYGVMDWLYTCFIIILIKFGMQSDFIVDFMSIFFANILTQKSTTYTACSSKLYKWYFSVSVRKTCQAQWNLFFCSGQATFLFIYIKTETSGCRVF